MADERPVTLSTGGPPQTILPAEPDWVLAELERAREAPDDARRDEVSAVVARHPAFLDAWARLAELARDDVEAYACYRVAYHRGLDKLRQAGWRGSGYVRWAHEPNRGFLRAVSGLGRQAAAIGEEAEALRCAEFLLQLDPSLRRET